jgi:hypothetical protein
MSSGMNMAEAEEIAKKMTYRDAVYNALRGRCVPYKKATRIKLNELLEMLDKGLTVTEFADNRWISVSERLPKADEYVGNIAKYYLVQNEYGDMMIARYTHSEYWVQMYQLKPIANEIVAWCELPTPFKAESEVRNG